MKYLLTFFMYCLLISPLRTLGQCDSTHLITEIPVKFAGEQIGLLTYFNNEISPIIDECNKPDNEEITRINIFLLINNFGKVTDVTFPKQDITKQCQDEIREKILTMKGWTPAYHKGQAVCSHFNYIISCIRKY